MTESALIPNELIEQHIYVIRGRKVMLDRDLANLYGVLNKALNQAVTRNVERFPDDFMFKLTTVESEALRSQFVTLKGRGKHSKYQPRVFTEQGVAMLATVLKSKRAIQVNIAIMRAFVQMRELLATHKGLADKLNHLEKKYDAQFRAVFDAIRELMAPPEKSTRSIGFAPAEER